MSAERDITGLSDGNGTIEALDNSQNENDTSPGQLQDVTMDNSYVFNKSPSQQHNGSTSPSQGRSVREFEEQMAGLRKENFNLKLRLYFLEEKLPGYSQANTPEGQESLMKQCIDTKVEVEILKKELAEKQVILIEAAEALNQMEIVQKTMTADSQETITGLRNEIQLLEMKNKELEKSIKKPSPKTLKDQSVGDYEVNDDSLQSSLDEKSEEFDNQICENEKLSNENQNLKEMVVEKMKTIEEIQSQLEQLSTEHEELKELNFKKIQDAERLLIEKINESKYLDEFFKVKSENDYLNREIEKLKKILDQERQKVISTSELSQRNDIMIARMQSLMLSKMETSNELEKKVEEYEHILYKLLNEKYSTRNKIHKYNNLLNEYGNNDNISWNDFNDYNYSFQIPSYLKQSNKTSKAESGQTSSSSKTTNLINDYMYNEFNFARLRRKNRLKKSACFKTEFNRKVSVNVNNWNNDEDDCTTIFAPKPSCFHRDHQLYSRPTIEHNRNRNLILNQNDANYTFPFNSKLKISISDACILKNDDYDYEQNSEKSSSEMLTAESSIDSRELY